MAAQSPSISREFADYCCELLASAGPCVARRMFGGWGISTDGLTLAIIADLGGGERLYLKASDETRDVFEAASCQRFVYQAKGKSMAMNYYSAPDEAMESPQLMQPWARLALECALKARTPSVKRTHHAIEPVAPRKPARAGPARSPARRGSAAAATPSAKPAVPGARRKSGAS